MLELRKENIFKVAENPWTLTDRKSIETWSLRITTLIFGSTYPAVARVQVCALPLFGGCGHGSATQEEGIDVLPNRVGVYEG
jgi:hypothetical protein